MSAREIKLSGGDFPLEVVRIPRQESMGMHVHACKELVIILRGSGIHGYAGDEHEISAGDVFLIDELAGHRYYRTDDLELVNVLFSLDGLGVPVWDLRDLPGYHVLFHLVPRQGPAEQFRRRLCLSREALNRVDRLISAIETELSERCAGYRHICSAYLMELIADICRSYSEIKPGSGEPILLVAKLLSYLESHQEKSLSLDELARNAHMSKSTLLRVFRRYVGSSPIEYLLRLKLQRSLALLRETELRIGEIAERVGFSDSNYFTRQFRRVHGQSPRDYRRANFKTLNDRKTGY